MMPRPTPRDNAGELGATPWKPFPGRMAPAPPPAPRASQTGVRRRLAVVVWPSPPARRAHARGRSQASTSRALNGNSPLAPSLPSH